MKTVAGLLLLANLAVFGWNATHNQPYSANLATHTAAYPASVESLVLLRERTGTLESAPGRSPRSTSHERISTSPADVALEHSARDTVGAGALSDDTVVESAATQTTDTSVPAQITSTAAMDTAATEPEPKSVAAAAEVDTTTLTTPPVCQTIGPFPLRTQADEFVNQLIAMGRASTLRSSQIEQPSGYWVYLPSMPQNAAQRIIDDLSAKGVKDYFLGRQNFISLGVFSEKRSAETRVSEISALGYAPRLEPRFLTREVFWVDLQESSVQRLGDAQWVSLLKEHADIRRQTVACE